MLLEYIIFIFKNENLIPNKILINSYFEFLLKFVKYLDSHKSLHNESAENSAFFL